MSYLLDTHVILDLSLRNKISRLAKIQVESSASLFISLASIWEIIIKTKIGKLKIDREVSDFIQEFKSSYECKSLPILEEHLNYYNNLRLYHRDPFDRLLISQAQYENLTLITKDQKIADYEVKALW